MKGASIKFCWINYGLSFWSSTCGSLLECGNDKRWTICCLSQTSLPASTFLVGYCIMAHGSLVMWTLLKSYNGAIILTLESNTVFRWNTPSEFFTQQPWHSWSLLTPRFPHHIACSEPAQNCKKKMPKIFCQGTKYENLIMIIIWNKTWNRK